MTDSNDPAVLAERIDALVERVKALEANQSRVVMGALGLAVLLIWEPIKRLVTSP